MFRKKYKHVRISIHRFRRILNAFFRSVRERLLEGNVFNLRNHMGYLRIIKIKQKPKPDENGKVRQMVSLEKTHKNMMVMSKEQIANREHIAYAHTFQFYKLVWLKWIYDEERTYLTGKQRNTYNFTIRPSTAFNLLMREIWNERTTRVSV